MSAKKTERKDDVSIPTSQETTTTESSQNQHAATNLTLDESRDNIRKAMDEARRQIPRYTQVVNDYQEVNIQTAREIADDYIESQKEIINLLRSVWVPYVENRTNWIMSPSRMTDIYVRAVSSFAYNTVVATRLANNTLFANMDALKTSIQLARDNAKELARVTVNIAKIFGQASRNTATNIG